MRQRRAAQRNVSCGGRSRGRSFEPQLILVSAGFDGHRDDPLAGCRLEVESFARMARLVRDLGSELGAPVGAVLEGGYEPRALAASVEATIGRWVAKTRRGRPPRPRRASGDRLLCRRAAP